MGIIWAFLFIFFAAFPARADICIGLCFRSGTAQNAVTSTDVEVDHKERKITITPAPSGKNTYLYIGRNKNNLSVVSVVSLLCSGQELNGFTGFGVELPSTSNSVTAPITMQVGLMAKQAILSNFAWLFHDRDTVYIEMVDGLCGPEARIELQDVNAEALRQTRRLGPYQLNWKSGFIFSDSLEITWDQ